MLTKEFFAAGKAIFTIEPSKQYIDSTPDKKSHYTYQIKRSKDGKVYFISFFTGRDNYNDYSYLGLFIPTTGEVKLTSKSRWTNDDRVVKIVSRTIKAIYENKQRQIEDNGWNVHHVGHCCRCGKRLTVPASIETGIGPECETFVALGIQSYDEVPNMVDHRIANLQYAYWMGGLKSMLFVLRDAFLDAGYDDNKATHWVEATKKVMRKFKKGKNLSADFVRFALPKHLHTVV